MSDSNRDFKGVWIPKEIWLDGNLTMADKVIFAEIDSLDTESGCNASNQYLADFCKCSERKVTESISKLIDLGLLRIENFNGRTRILRSNLCVNVRGRVAKSARQSRRKQQPYIVNNINNYSTDDKIDDYKRNNHQDDYKESVFVVKPDGSTKLGNEPELEETDKASKPITQPLLAQKTLGVSDEQKENDELVDRSLKEFLDRYPAIVIDVYGTGQLSLLDFAEIMKCFDESSYLRDNCNSLQWLVKNRSAVLSGKYKDKPKIELTENNQSSNSGLPTNWVQDETGCWKPSWGK